MPSEGFGLQLLVMVTLMLHVCHSQTHAGTTENIDQIFTGRCFEYEEVVVKESHLPSVQAPCSSLWTEFMNAFSYRPPCDVKIDSYEPFLHASKQEIPKDKILCWSGVFGIAHRFAQAKTLVTLEDTLMGYLASSLTWCGQSVDPGLNYTRCPAWEDCPLEASESFWAGASAMFASQARGIVTLVLDGSNPSKPAYRRDSFFGKYELPNLSQTFVTEVRVLIVHNLAKQIVDTCKSTSIQQLKFDLDLRGLQMTCEDNPQSIVYLLCAEDSSSRECNAVRDHMDGMLRYRENNIPLTFNQKPHDFF